jgi:sortase A
LAVVVLAGGALVALDLGSPPETIASFNKESATTTTSTTTTTTPPTTTSSTTTTTTTTSTTTTSTTTTTTTTLPVQETEPIAPPSNPHGAENLGQLGSMSIPKIGVNAPLLEGIRLTTLDRGPGHWPGTAMPGEVGNVVVAGHRTSHAADFRNLDQLVPGDDVVFTTGAGVITYKVTRTHIVQPDAIWIVDPTDTPTATLFACHPLGSTAQRIVVNLELAS